MTVMLAQLLEDSPKLVVAEPDETVGAAMERMLEHDYSQLPVVSDRNQPRAIGIISTGTIARAAFHLEIPPAKLLVQHAIDEHPIKKRFDDDLWRTLDETRDGEVLLVEDGQGLLCGILTGHDFTNFLRHQSEDSITVLEIEHTIKQLIIDHYHGRDAELHELVRRELGVHQRQMKKDVRKLVNSCLQSVSVSPGQLDNGKWEQLFEQHLPDKIIYEFDLLSFNQYLQIFGSGECGAAYEKEFGLPSGNLNALLGVVRDLRNQIMHNRGLPTTAQRAKLVFCRELLSRVADRRTQQATTMVEPLPSPTPPVEPVHAVTAVEPGRDDSPTDEPLREISTRLEGVDKGEDRITWTFDDLDELSRRGLPADARKHRSWWTNDEDVPHSAIWLDVGWRVVSVNLSAGTVTFGRNTQKEEQCIAAFNALFRHLAESGDWSLPIPSPAGRTWQTIARITRAGVTAELNLGFAKDERFRISLYIGAGEKDSNKAVFNELSRHRNAVEKLVGAPLGWQLLPHRRASRIELYYPREVSIRSEDDAIEELAEWVAVHAPKFHEAMRKSYDGEA